MCVYMYAHAPQSCLTFCNPMDGSPPGSSVHGILHTGIQEWVAMPSSRGSSPLRDQICVSWSGRQILYRWVTWEALRNVYCVINIFKIFYMLWYFGILRILFAWEKTTPPGTRQFFKIFIWLRWVLIAAQRIFLASCMIFFAAHMLQLWHMGSRAHGLCSCSGWA